MEPLFQMERNCVHSSRDIKESYPIYPGFQGEYCAYAEFKLAPGKWVKVSLHIDCTIELSINMGIHGKWGALVYYPKQCEFNPEPGALNTEPNLELVRSFVKEVRQALQEQA